jgi:hypothetical protein
MGHKTSLAREEARRAGTPEFSGKAGSERFHPMVLMSKFEADYLDLGVLSVIGRNASEL